MRQPLEPDVAASQDRFDRAELTGDTAELGDLLAEQFYSVGPKGFVMTRQQWIDRHVHFNYDELRVSDREVFRYGDSTAIARNVQQNKATYGEQQVELTVMVSQVWVVEAAQWRLAAIQFSPTETGQ